MQFAVHCDFSIVFAGVFFCVFVYTEWYHQILGVCGEGLVLKRYYDSPVLDIKMVHNGHYFNGRSLRHRYIAYLDTYGLVAFKTKQQLERINRMTFFEERLFQQYIGKEHCTIIAINEHVRCSRAASCKYGSFTFIVSKQRVDRKWYFTVASASILDKWVRLLVDKPGRRLPYFDGRNDKNDPLHHHHGAPNGGLRSDRHYEWSPELSTMRFGNSTYGPFSAIETNGTTDRTLKTQHERVLRELHDTRTEKNGIEERMREKEQEDNLMKYQLQLGTKDRIVSNYNESDQPLNSTFDDELGDSKPFRYGEYLEYWRRGYSNSVSPKYKDLRDELTNNNVAQISNKKYNELCKKARRLLTERPLIAKQVGHNNEICGIEEGSAPSMEHLIALMIYTDFNYLQRKFKEQCRRSCANESLKELVCRNSEIYHWCKLIKEMCIFYGEIMGENDVLYTGLGEFLLFNSLSTRFECPISTSTKLDVATTFAKGAISLKFKRGSPNTKILDVTGYSCFGKKEAERLVAGSTLQIVDILINNKSHKTYVSALRMLEQIINGHFIDGDDKMVLELISLLRYVVSPTLMDKLQTLSLSHSVYELLEDERHDTDSVIEDITDETSSEISKRFGSSLVAEIRKCSDGHIGMYHRATLRSIVTP